MKRLIITTISLLVYLFSTAQEAVWKLDIYMGEIVPYFSIPIEFLINSNNDPEPTHSFSFNRNVMRFKTKDGEGNTESYKLTFNVPHGNKLCYRLDEGYAETLDVIDVGHHTATLAGRVNGVSASTTVGIEYVASGSSEISRASMEADGYFVVSLTNLDYGTRYYYRTFAVVNGKKYYGDYKRFTTEIPVVTGNATNIKANSVTINGNVNGVTNPITCDIQYRQSTSSTYEEQSTTSDGYFSFDITGLSDGTTYYYRAFARNEQQTSYGVEKNFQTVKETYEVGEYYPNEYNREGIVYYVDSSKKHGMIYSMDYAYLSWKQGRTWCSNKGTGWSMPSLNELKRIANLWQKISNYPETGFYWSSTDYGSLNGADPDYNLYYKVCLGGWSGYTSGTAVENTGSVNNLVLAVKAF